MTNTRFHPTYAPRLAKTIERAIQRSIRQNVPRLPYPVSLCEHRTRARKARGPCHVIESGTRYAYAVQRHNSPIVRLREL
jgi:hypothetical protein